MPLNHLMGAPPPLWLGALDGLAVECGAAALRADPPVFLIMGGLKVRAGAPDEVE